MADLIIYLPGHGYSDDDPIYLSWLDYYGYVTDPQTDSFKVDDGAGINVQFSTTVTDGYVREYDDATGSSTISGLDHLEGETVYVTAGGSVVGSYTVSSGSITVPSDVYTYQVGLPYSLKVKTMKIEVPQGTVQSRVKRINEVVTRYIRAKNGQAGTEYGGTEYVTDMDATFSTEAQDATVLSSGGFDESGQVVIKSSDPYPFTILATIISFSVDEQR